MAANGNSSKHPSWVNSCLGEKLQRWKFEHEVM